MLMNIKTKINIAHFPTPNHEHRACSSVVGVLWERLCLEFYFVLCDLESMSV